MLRPLSSSLARKYYERMQSISEFCSLENIRRFCTDFKKFRILFLLVLIVEAYRPTFFLAQLFVR